MFIRSPLTGKNVHVKLKNQRQHNAKRDESVDLHAQNVVRSAIYRVVLTLNRRGSLPKLDFNSPIPVLTVSSVLDTRVLHVLPLGE